MGPRFADPEYKLNCNGNKVACSKYEFTKSTGLKTNKPLNQPKLQALAMSVFQKIIQIAESPQKTSSDSENPLYSYKNDTYIDRVPYFH